jgi:hypothetical protein
MIVSHKHRFIFLKTRKTAGTSIEYGLRQICGSEDVITPTIEEKLPGNVVALPAEGIGPQNYVHRHRWLMRLRPWKYGVENRLARRGFEQHMTAASARKFLSARVWNSYFKFSVERNPWDRQVSLYYWRMRSRAERETFEEFLRRSPAPIIRNWDNYAIGGEIITDRIIRYESLASDYDEVLAGLGVDASDAPLQQMKTGLRAVESYRAHYTEETKELVRRWYEREIDRFSYQF